MGDLDEDIRQYAIMLGAQNKPKNQIEFLN